MTNNDRPFVKRILLSLVLAVMVALFPLAGAVTGNMTVDIAIVLALLFALAYRTQFPFSSETFTINEPGEKLLAVPLIGFMNALAVFILPALAAYSLGLTLGQLLLLYLSTLIAIQAFQIKKEHAGFVREKNAKKGENYYSLNLLFWGAVAVGLIMGIHYGCWLSGDYTWHGTYIRKLRELSHVQFGNYLLKDLPYPQYGHNIWHLFLALLSYITNLDTSFIWINCNLMVPLVRIGAFYFLSKEIFKGSPYWAKISTLVLIVIDLFFAVGSDGVTPFYEHNWSWDVPYPSEISREVFLGMLIYYLFRSINRRALFRVQVFALSLCIALTHFFYMFQLSFLLAVLFIASFLIKNEETIFFRHSLGSYLPLLVPALAYMLVYKQLLDTPTVNSIFLSTSAVGDWCNRVIFIKGKYPFIHPWRGFFKNPAYAFGILSCIPLAVSLRKTPSFWKLYMISVTVALAAIFFNPPMLFFLQKFNPALDRIWRLFEVLPGKLLIVGSFYYIVEENKWLKKTVLNTALYIGLIALLPLIMKFQKEIVYTADTWKKGAYEHSQVNQIVKRYIPAGSVVFADPAIAWTWTTILPHYLYMHPFPGGLPPSFNPDPRMKVWKSFFENSITTDMVRDLNENKVDYLLLTRNTFERKRGELESVKTYFEDPAVIQEVNLVAVKLKDTPWPANK